MSKIPAKKIFLILSILIISAVNVSSAPLFKHFSEEQKTFRAGKKHFKKEHYNLALPCFLSLLQEYPDNPNFNYCAGMCYYNISSIYDSTIYYLTRATDQKDAITLYYKNTYKANKAPAKVFFHLGTAYFRNNMPETAIRHFKHYQRYLEPEVKWQRSINDDVNLQIEICENEKDYAAKQRQLRTAARDSLTNEIAFYKVNYEGTAQLLEMKTNETIHLMQEVEKYNKSKNRPIGAPSEMIPNKAAPFTIQIMASEQDLPLSNFSNIPNLKKCRTADGLYYYLLGEFATREEAETKCKEIRNLGYPNAWVRPAF